MSRTLTARALVAGLLITAASTPAFAGGPMRSYTPAASQLLTPRSVAVAPTPGSPAAATPMPTPTMNAGRDNVSFGRVQAGAKVGDSFLRLAPTTNNGHFSQLDNYQGSISATTTVNGDNHGNVITNQNGNILGLIGNNGIVDSSAMVGADTGSAK